MLAWAPRARHELARNVRQGMAWPCPCSRTWDARRATPTVGRLPLVTAVSSAQPLMEVLPSTAALLS